MSVKFQVTLPEPLMAELKAESDKRGISVAEFIRQTVDDNLRKTKRAANRDPFEAIDCLIDSDETDLAARVDRFSIGEGVCRYGVLHRRNQPTGPVA